MVKSKRKMEVTHTRIDPAPPPFTSGSWLSDWLSGNEWSMMDCWSDGERPGESPHAGATIDNVAIIGTYIFSSFFFFKKKKRKNKKKNIVLLLYVLFEWTMKYGEIKPSSCRILARKL